MKIIGKLFINIGISIFFINIILKYFEFDISCYLTFSLSLMLILPFFGSVILFSERYLKQPAGIDNNNIYSNTLTGRGIGAYILTILLTLIYILIYFGDKIELAGYNINLILTKYVYNQLNPLSNLLQNHNADNWFFYSTFYTYAILLYGIRMIMKYRHNNYQIIRTISVMFFQLGFAYIIPNILKLFKQPGFYFSYFWPLKPEYLYPYTWMQFSNQSKLAILFLIISVFISFVAVPVLTYFFGKRWYCSWVCGCGGLANTAGDFFRQHSSKTLLSWKIERILVYSILALITFITIALWINSLTSGKIFGKYSQLLAQWYGFYIGAIWSGVIGVGFYPLLGTRIWCRFGCPQAAILGIIQRFFSRFRITTNGGQCISCGNCSVYCEMGIDVRSYAQKGQNIVRASCVGCGICAAVCPRGVLKLENGKWELAYSTYDARTGHTYF
ncbi:MAG: hypothetical protein KatS3mg129_2376 [Leptospiraceae bacterium]|nr:MAG: hypothetical protein KatS3mg129_2376 [Leptospiraceae bacterium]